MLAVATLWKIDIGGRTATEMECVGADYTWENRPVLKQNGAQVLKMKICADTTVSDFDVKMHDRSSCVAWLQKFPTLRLSEGTECGRRDGCQVVSARTHHHADLRVLRCRRRREGCSKIRREMLTVHVTITTMSMSSPTLRLCWLFSDITLKRTMELLSPKMAGLKFLPGQRGRGQRRPTQRGPEQRGKPQALQKATKGRPQE